jgi:hypothetical protein
MINDDFRECPAFPCRRQLKLAVSYSYFAEIGLPVAAAA